MAGIEQAIESSLTNIRAMQTGFKSASDNIANVNDENFSKRSLKLATSYTAGQISGVKVEGIERFEDKFLDKAIRESSSQYQKDETVRDYLEQIISVIGKVGDQNNPNLVIDQSFRLLTQLSNNVDNLSLKDEARNRLKNTAYIISNLAQVAYNYQYEADKEIENSVGTVNGLINELYQVNIDINAASMINGEATNLLDKRDGLLKDLSKYLDCKVSYGPRGNIEVSLSDGTSILATYKTEIEYTSQIGVDNFIRKDYLNPMYVHAYNSGGGINMTREIVSSNFDKPEVSTVLSGGKIKGLLEVRDKYVPKYLEMLNKLADKLSEEFNKIHNMGSGHPPLSSYASTRPIAASDTRQWQGNVTFAVVDKLGNAIKRDDGSVVKPLDLNLSKVTSETLDGKLSFKTIMDEFNRYFKDDVSAPRASLGRLEQANSYSDQYLLRDIRIAATSNMATTPLGVFKFDIELDNDSQFNSEFQVLDVVVKDSLGAIVNNALTSVLPGSFKAEAGIRQRTGQEISVNFGAIPSAGGPFTIEIQTRVAGDNGEMSAGSLIFKIDDNPLDSQIINKRYLPEAVTGGVKLIDARNNIPYAQAKLVDDNGNEILSGNEVGRLVIETYNSDMRLVIQDDTSQDLGVPEKSIEGTNRGFGHYLGINDLFAQNYTDSDNSALNLKLRTDIEAVSSNISTGQLTTLPEQYTQVTIDARKATGAIKFNVLGSLPSQGDSLTINGSVFNFSDGTLPLPANPITIGVDWNSTINNILSALQATNANTANKADRADYHLTSTDTISIDSKFTGIYGNSFSFQSNFITSGINVSLNGRKPVTLDNVNLFGGVDRREIESVPSYGYKLSVGANQIVQKMSKLSSKTLYFERSAITPGVSTTLTGYVSAFVSTLTGDVSFAKISAQNTRSTYEGYFNRFKQAGGVNQDEQMIEILKYQHSYSASAKVINVAKTLMDTLLSNL
jgi:flagellar hook-associated protein 1 FlgK